MQCWTCAFSPTSSTICPSLDAKSLQAGRYLDRIVRTEGGLRFQQKRCIYDTLRVQTLLAFPV